MKLSKKYIWNILLILAVTAIAMYFALKDNFTDIVDALSRMNKWMMILVLCWGLLYNCIWGVSYQVLAKRYKKNYSLLSGLIVAFVGTFFAGITPSSTGGQFGQIYVLKKQGINYSDGASLLWADFIIYQTTMMIYVTILFALRFMHYANLSAWFWIVFAGYVINLGVIIFLYTMALFPRLYINLLNRLTKWLAKLKFFKNPEATVEKWTSSMENFTVEIKQLSQDKRVIVQCMFINFLRLTLYYALPFVVARGLGIGLSLQQLIDVMALSSFVTMANSFIPLPGASGGTEVVFTLLFSRMLGKLTGAVLLLWRVSSYYVPLLTGAAIFVFFQNHEESRKGQNGTKDEGAESDQKALEHTKIPLSSDPNLNRTKTLSP